jgi:hypothetical protein
MKRALVMMVVASSALAAPGILPSAAAVSPEVRGQWATQIRLAQAKQASAFAAVSKLRQAVERLDAQKRGRLAPMGPALKALLPRGEAALLEAAVFEGPLPDGLAPSAILAWHVGLLEALGSSRNGKLLPLYEAVVQNDARPEVIRAAAEAAGKLGSDEAMAVLRVAVAGVGGDAAALGLGECRRLAAAQLLAARTREVAPGLMQLKLIRAMARLGSPWAWQTAQGAPPAAEANAIQSVLVQTLAQLYVGQQGDARQHAADALVQINAPHTVAELQKMRARDVAAVDALVARLSVVKQQ